MYHAVLTPVATSAERRRMLDGDKLLSDPGAWRYTLEQPVFDDQMRLLAQLGCATATGWEQPLEADSQPRVWVTFDDGHRSNFELALPILMKYGLKALFFITTDWIGEADFMAEGQLRELRRCGMLIGSHGCSHRFFSEMSPQTVREELARSKRRLEEVLNEPVTAVSLPGGRSHPTIRAAAREIGYQHLFTSTVALADSAGDPLDWPRIPITNDLSPACAARLLRADRAAVRRMARTMALRAVVRRVFGVNFLKRIRALMPGR